MDGITEEEGGKAAEKENHTCSEIGCGVSSVVSSTSREEWRKAAERVRVFEYP